MDADAATQPAPEIPPAARPGPQIVEDHVLLRHDQPIDIGKGEMVPLGALLACRHRRCRHCEDGWVHRPQPDGSRRASVCGCCVEGWRKEQGHNRTLTISLAAPAIGVAPLADLERARLRVERLARDLAALEADRAEREQRFTADNAELLAAARSAAASAQDEFALGLRATTEVEYLQAGVVDAEKALAIVRAALAGAEAQAEAHREGRALALAMQGDADREIERRRGGLNLERLDRDIAKARRRLTGARIYGGVADAPAPATEGA